MPLRIVELIAWIESYTIRKQWQWHLLQQTNPSNDPRYDSIWTNPAHVPQLGAPASVTYGVCFKSCYCSCFCYVIADTLRDNELEGCIHRLPQETHRCSPDPQAAELILIKVSLKKPVASVWKYKFVCAEDRGSRLLRHIGTHPPDYTASHSILYFWCSLHCENQAPYANNYVICPA
jgi:hypothetical protein